MEKRVNIDTALCEFWENPEIITVHESDENKGSLSKGLSDILHKLTFSGCHGEPSVAHKVTTSPDLLCIVLETSGSISWVGSLQDIKGGGGVFSPFSFPFLHPPS